MGLSIVAVVVSVLATACTGVTGSDGTPSAQRSTGDLYTDDGTPIVGRLQTQDGTIDLTVHAFGPGDGEVDPEAHARPVMADIDTRRDADTDAASR